MITVRAPLRITLGGGGTDLPQWYKHHGGFLIAGAINKYIYVTGCKRPFDGKIWLSYSSTEVRDSVEEIKHELFARCLVKFDLTEGVELHSISEVPGNTGLGSSGAFLVAVLLIMSTMQKRDITIRDIAELACRIEMEELARSSGKQDQYVSAFGGIVTMAVDTDGKVDISPLPLDDITKRRLHDNTLIYYSGVSRNANTILREQNSRMQSKSEASLSGMNRIQEIAHESKRHLLSGDLDQFGRLLHEHWEVKKTMASGMSTANVDELYYYARECGALGGKLIGAGGGGFFMFYVPPEHQLVFRHQMASRGLTEMEWQFDYAGATKVFTS